DEPSCSERETDVDVLLVRAELIVTEVALRIDNRVEIRVLVDRCIRVVRPFLEMQQDGFERLPVAAGDVDDLPRTIVSLVCLHRGVVWPSATLRRTIRLLSA